MTLQSVVSKIHDGCSRKNRGQVCKRERNCVACHICMHSRYGRGHVTYGGAGWGSGWGLGLFGGRENGCLLDRLLRL